MTSRTIYLQHHSAGSCCAPAGRQTPRAASALFVTSRLTRISASINYRATCRLYVYCLPEAAGGRRPQLLFSAFHTAVCTTLVVPPLIILRHSTCYLRNTRRISIRCISCLSNLPRDFSTTQCTIELLVQHHIRAHAPGSIPAMATQQHSRRAILP